MKSAFLAVPLFCGTFLFAQGPGWHGHGSDTPPTPAQIAQDETNRLTKFFSLTSTQQSAVLAILTSSETQIVALRTQIQPLRTSLTAAIKANNSGQINATLQQISPLEEQIQAAQAGAAGQIYATVLTSTQQAQLTNGLGPLMGGPMGGGGFRGRH
jgi:hypothetical protein